MHRGKGVIRRQILTALCATNSAMRIARLDIANFRGIRRLELDGLETEPLVVISGANGAGKSLLLEAIFFASSMWHFGMPDAGCIGPWGPSAHVELSVWLSSEERRRLEALRDEHQPAVAGSAPEYLTLGFESRANGASPIHSDQWLSLLTTTAQAVGQTFGVVDYLPADRQIPRGEAASISTEVLSEQRTRDLRQQAFQAARNRSVFALSGVQPVLATLDYLDLIQQRAEGGEIGGEYEMLTSAFERATGKRIPRPLPDPSGASGARLVVETPAGPSHRLDDLSSGEQSVLGLMFYVRRLSSSGGVLLIDEPELHLHPALHPLLFDVLGDVAERAQIWTVTHSTRLVSSASAQALVHLRAANEQQANQGERVRDDHARVALLLDLGIDPAEALQADLLLVVEGDSDRQWLQRLLPIETGRAQFVIAGNAEGVLATSRALADGYGGHWLAIRDRDLLSSDHLERLTERDPHVFVWPQRMVENELLHPPLIASTFGSVGRATSVEEARQLIKGLFDRQRPQIEAGLVEQRLRAEHTIDAGAGQSVDQIRTYLAAVREVADRKLERIDAVTAEIAAELDAADFDQRAELLDGKRALRELVAESPFGRYADLVDALVFQARQRVDARPLGVEMLRQRILVEATEFRLGR